MGVERLAGDVRFLSIARAPSAADASGSGYRTVLLDLKGPPPVRRARPYAPGPPSAIRYRRAVSVRANSRASSTNEGRTGRFAVAHGSAPPDKYMLLFYCQMRHLQLLLVGQAINHQ